MSYRGRYQLGQSIPLLLQCVNASGVPTVPDAAPTLEVWSSSAKVQSLLIPVIDRYQVTGLFTYTLFLDQSYAAGGYRAVFSWRSGTFRGLTVDHIEVLAGGDGRGAVIAMHYYLRPHARFLVQELNSGLLIKGRNPVV